MVERKDRPRRRCATTSRTRRASCTRQRWWAAHSRKRRAARSRRCCRHHGFARVAWTLLLAVLLPDACPQPWQSPPRVRGAAGAVPARALPPRLHAQPRPPVPPLQPRPPPHKLGVCRSLRTSALAQPWQPNLLNARAGALRSRPASARAAPRACPRGSGELAQPPRRARRDGAAQEYEFSERRPEGPARARAEFARRRAPERWMKGSLSRVFRRSSRP